MGTHSSCMPPSPYPTYSSCVRSLMSRFDLIYLVLDKPEVRKQLQLLGYGAQEVGSTSDER